MAASTYLGILLKPSYTPKNLLAIPLISIPVTLTIYFFTAHLIFLLRSPSYYNLDSTSDINHLTNHLTFVSMPFQMLSVVLIGYVYDLFGRRYTIISTLLLQSMCFYLVPMGAPEVYPIVQAMRGLQLVANACTVVHPLINDYVERETRGRANALQVLGLSLGDLFNYMLWL